MKERTSSADIFASAASSSGASARAQLTHEQVERLVKRATAGSEQAFSELYEAYLPPIFAYARKRLQDDDAAAEVVQDTFLAALMKLDRLKNPRAFHSWIFSIASAYIAGAQRSTRTKAVREQSLDVLTDRVQAAASTQQPSPLAENLTSTDAATNPSSALDTKEDRLALISAIDALSDDQKEAILLRYFAGLSVSEIAAVANTSQNTMLKRLYDARARLRAFMRTDANDDQLAAALCESGQTAAAINAQSGLGARVTVGLAGALPLMLTGVEKSSPLASRAQAFEELASKAKVEANPAAAAQAATNVPTAAPAAAAHALPLAAKAALVIAAAVIAAGGGYALYRHNTAAPAAPAASAENAVDPATSGPASSDVTATAAAAAPTPGNAAAQAAPAPTPAPAAPTPTPTPAHPAAPAVSQASPSTPAPASTPTAIRPSVTVAHATLTYPAGTSPVSAAGLLSAAGAAAQAPDGAALPVTLSGYQNIEWSQAGSYLCYVQAADSTGLGARTQVITVVVQ